VTRGIPIPPMALRLRRRDQPPAPAGAAASRVQFEKDVGPSSRRAARCVRTDSTKIKVRSLGLTLKGWRMQIVAWHNAHFTDGPTEALNNSTKRVKRAAFGFTSFRNYRVRSRLHAGNPNLSLLATITPR